MYFADAVNGDDRNDGLTPASAFATLERLNELIKNGEKMEV